MARGFLRWTHGTNPRYERWRWQIFTITWLAYAGLALTRKSFVLAKVEIGEGTAIGLSETQLAWIDGSFLIAYAGSQIFWGIAGDRWGARKVLMVGMVCSAAVATAMGAASTAIAFGVFFFLQGLCQSCGWAPLLKNIGNFFSRRERGMVLGLWGTNYAIGGAAAAVVVGYVGQWLGWRWAFFVPAGLLVLVACLFSLFQRNRPEDVGLPPIEAYHMEPVSVVTAGDSSATEVEGSWTLVKQTLTHPMILLLGFAYFLLKPARYAMLFWGPRFVSDRLGSDMGEAGFLSGLFELAGPISIVLAGACSDRLFGSRRIPVTVFSLVLLAALFLAVGELAHTRWTLAVCLFGMGLLVHAPDMLIGGIAAVDFGTKKGASTASGFINTLGSVGAIAGGVVPGILIVRWGWESVFYVLGAGVLGAALLLLPKWNALPPVDKEVQAPDPESPRSDPRKLG